MWCECVWVRAGCAQGAALCRTVREGGEGCWGAIPIGCAVSTVESPACYKSRYIKNTIAALRKLLYTTVSFCHTRRGVGAAVEAAGWINYY